MYSRHPTLAERRRTLRRQSLRQILLLTAFIALLLAAWVAYATMIHGY